MLSTHIGICTNFNIVANAYPKRNHVYTASIDDALYSTHREEKLIIIRATSLALGNSMPHPENIFVRHHRRK
jgi:hypothetical protein